MCDFLSEFNSSGSEQEETWELDNFTQLTQPGDGSEEIYFQSLKFYSYTVLLPLIFMFGVVGNVLNIIIFTRSRYRHTLDDIEKSANAGLVALALSDMLFCLVGLPDPFLSSQSGSRLGGRFAMYYMTYKTPLMNVFLFSSTWLIVAISVERYIACCYPFHARWFIELPRTIAVDVSIYVLSVLINIPGFLKYRFISMPGGCTEDSDPILIKQFRPFYDSSFREGYMIAWSVLGAFIPLVFLTLCNIRLLIEVYRSRARYATEQHKYTTSKVTIILISIILMYLLLVCPSMLLQFFKNMITESSQKYYNRYRTAEVITNVSQAFNFAVNFVLYCAVSKQFRDNVKGHLCCLKDTSKTTQSETNNRYQLVGQQKKEKVTVKESLPDDSSPKTTTVTMDDTHANTVTKV